MMIMAGVASRLEVNYRARPSPVLLADPTSKAMLDGYRKENLNRSEPSISRHKPLNLEPMQRSELVDVKDPIQVHLLTEIALSDSKGFEILSQEEVDHLKKQMQSLLTRIEQTRANLAIQSKYRDAAISMAKLYSPEKMDGKRHSLLGNQTNGGGSANEAESERMASERKCEELAQELFALEKRVMEPQRRLLQHTAGILQLTHTALLRKTMAFAPGQPLPSGIPGSPESLYTDSNDGNSLKAAKDEGIFDEESLHLPLDSLDDRHGQNTIGIPPKSPIREWNGQLREEADRLKEQNTRLKEAEEQLRADVVMMREKSAGREQALLDAEEKLAMLNGKLRALVVQFNPAKTEGCEKAPPAGQGGSLVAQLSYLETGLGMAADEQAEAMQRQGQDATSRQNLDQAETVLMGLWDIIKSGYAEMQQQRAGRRKSKALQGLEQDEDDMDADEPLEPNEAYTLQAFSAKVQWLYAQATSLREQETMLKRQIQQQRAMKIKSDEQKEDELDSTKQALISVKQEAKDTQQKLAKALANLEIMQATHAANDSAAARAVQEQLQERNAKILSLEASSKDAEARRRAAEAKLESMQERLAQAYEVKEAAAKSAHKLQQEVEAKDEEVERLNMMVIELKTELTFAKAELEGAYGSRAQRAKEAAALSKSSEVAELQDQVDTLKAELASTLKEFEEVTKETLTAEKERLELENKLDDAVGAQANLEAEAKALRERLGTEVGRLTEQLDAERLKAPPSPGPGSSGPRVGASMLSAQFRATMKEERKKFQEELREEQARRRQVEDELRAAKKALGLGRGPLGPLSPR